MRNLLSAAKTKSQIFLFLMLLFALISIIIARVEQESGGGTIYR